MLKRIFHLLFVQTVLSGITLFIVIVNNFEDQFIAILHFVHTCSAKALLVITALFLLKYVKRLITTYCKNKKTDPFPLIMGKKKVIFASLATVLLISVAGQGFASQYPVSSNIEKSPPYGDFNGTVTGSGKGWARTPIEVTLTLVNGYITKVDINHRETPRYVRTLMEHAKSIIPQTNSFDDIDVISGATVTRNGLMEAGRNALGQIN
jgi:uncharacterized protein with FMN-binding domain